ncbi:DUF2270 domain-containing protein [Methylobacterium nigriterrae]|uniref:DUF2270 domain-containing protein n=1 Tax=Methylobacterium nigriterrae TaxID=3127512 RepID=UPI0030135D30
MEHVPPPEAGEPASVPLPRSPGEIITVLAHYHRAEISRMAGWRDRIDRTTNWAITVIAAMLSVSLSTPSAHHGVLLFAMLLVMLLLAIEARRYRFFDVYRARVRRLERHYYAEVFAPRPGAPAAWTGELGQDLRQPVFRIALGDAVSRRLRRNYCWMFMILLLAWVLKITSAKLQPGSGGAEFVHGPADILSNAALGPLPGALVLGCVAAFYLWILAATLRSYRRDRAGEDGPVHV